MVNRPIALASVVLVLVVAGWGVASPQDDGVAASPPSSIEADAGAVSAVREALSGRGYPWYDPKADDFRPVMPPRPPAPNTPGSGSRGPRLNIGEISLQEVGQLIVFVLLAAGLTALILFVARSWQRRLAAEERASPSGPARVTGGPARTGSLPTGLMVDESDPLEAARLLRGRGDRSRAVVLLFAHQLLALDRLGLIRMAPGRTGRQLVRSIGDDAIRGPVGRTLRMFEDVYYGHREPEPDAFEALWAEAEALERRFASGVAS